MEPGQYSAAGRVLRIDRNAIASHAKLLADLIDTDDLRHEFIQTRGMTRKIGVLTKTSVVHLEQAAQYYLKESATCPGKHDVVTNPTDRSEKKQKVVQEMLLKNK